MKFYNEIKRGAWRLGRFRFTYVYVGTVRCWRIEGRRISVNFEFSEGRIALEVERC
jgi:hypothetical protein